MAIPSGDGGIILTTEVDTGGVEKGIKNIRNATQKMSNALKGMGAQLTKSTTQNKGVAKLEKEFEKTNETIEKTKNKIQEVYAQLDALQENAFKAPDTGEVILTGTEQKQFAKLNAQLDVLEPKLEKDKIKAQELQRAIDGASRGTIPGITTLTKGMTRLGQRITSLVKRVFVFSALLRILRALADVIKNVAMGDDEFRHSVEKLKAALWTAFTPVLNVIVPALKTMVNWLTTAVIWIGKFFAAITGKSYTALTKNAKTLKQQADNYKNVGDSAKEAKKQLAVFDEIDILASSTSGGAGGMDGFGQLGGIDYSSELALIGMVTGWALVGLGIIVMFSGHPFVGAAMVVSGYAVSKEAAASGVKLGENEKKELAKIGTITGVALVGLGVLLLFTPIHWKYGLAMIGTGVAAIYSAVTLGKFSQDIMTLVSEILLISGIVAFTLGVVLLFVNSAWKYGLALMALGVVEVVAALELGGDALKEELQSFVLQYWKQLYTIGALMAVVGIILLFCKQWKYGLTLLIAGITVVASATIMGGDPLKDELKTFVVNYWEVIYGIAALMVVVGIVLLFCQIWGIGITLILSGIATIVTATVLGGNPLKDALKTFVTNYWEVLYGISALMVVVGIVLLFCSVWAVGITLIVAGIGSLVGVTLLGGGDLKQAIKDTVVPFKDEIATISAVVFVLGAVLMFVPGCLGVGLTLLGLGATALYGASKLDSSALSNQLTTELNKVNNSAKTGVKNINDSLAGINIPGGANVNLARYIAPKNGYAHGTVVPPNRPHWALFGDNKQEPEIVSPISTMKSAFVEAMTEMGGGFGDTEVVLEVDGEVFGRVVVEQGNRTRRKIGTRLVTV